MPLFTANFRHNREFYARPNRLQKSIWPPAEFDAKRLASVKETVNNENNGKSMSNTGDWVDNIDATNKRISGDSLTHSSALQPWSLTSASTNESMMPLQPKSTNTLPPHRLANHLAREQFYNGTKEIVVVPQLHTQTGNSSEMASNEKPMETEENK